MGDQIEPVSLQVSWDVLQFVLLDLPPYEIKSQHLLFQALRLRNSKDNMFP
jgi:hypothetical protein